MTGRMIKAMTAAARFISTTGLQQVFPGHAVCNFIVRTGVELGAGRTNQMLAHQWHLRGPDRMPEPLWRATVMRVRSEFDEMPCLRVTPDQACVLFGLTGRVSDWILNRLAAEGFLVLTPEGQYVRRNAGP